MNKKRFIISLVLFALVICVLGFPFTEWGFFYDDFGLITSARFERLLDFFTTHGANSSFQPSNVTHVQESFFSVFFRPLIFVVTTLQRLVFGINPYPYFLSIIFIHAVNTVFLFNIFLNYFGYLLAAWGSLFFAFAPSLYNHLGWICCLQYQLDLFFLLLAIMSLKKFLDYPLTLCSRLLYLFSCTCIVLALFTRETLIVTPVWVMGVVFLYAYLQTKSQNTQFFRKSFIQNSILALRTSLGYWLVTCFYLGFRAYFFPITNNTSAFGCESSLRAFIARMQDRFFDFVSFVSDLLGLCWLPENNRMLKGFLIILIFSWLLWLFFTSKKKLLMFFSLASVVVFSWPALLIQYRARYIYTALPFFVLFILLGLRDRKKTYEFLWFALACNMIFLVKQFKTREQTTHLVTCASQLLANDPQIQGRALCFIGLPDSLFRAGVAHAVWIYGTNVGLPIFTDELTWTDWASQRSFKDSAVPLIIPDQSSIKFILQNPSQVWFMHISSKLTKTQLGIVCINRMVGSKPIDIDLMVDKKWAQHNPLFITWDYEKNMFKILE